MRRIPFNFDLFSLQILEFSDRDSATRCARCMKLCNGETLRYNDKLFHANCLVCLGMYCRTVSKFLSSQLREARHFIHRVLFIRSHFLHRNLHF